MLTVTIASIVLLTLFKQTRLIIPVILGFIVSAIFSGVFLIVGTFIKGISYVMHRNKVVPYHNSKSDTYYPYHMQHAA